VGSDDAGAGRHAGDGGAEHGGCHLRQYHSCVCVCVMSASLLRARGKSDGAKEKSCSLSQRLDRSDTWVAYNAPAPRHLPRSSASPS
jgi:hypothetical protein